MAATAHADGTATPCTGGSAGEYSRYNCEEDAHSPSHDRKDPFGRKPETAMVLTDGNWEWGLKRWYQDGLWHTHLRNMPFYFIIGSNGDDKVRLQKYHAQANSVFPKEMLISTGGGDDTVHGTDGNDHIGPLAADLAAPMYRGFFTTFHPDKFDEPDIHEKADGYYRELGCWESTAQADCETLKETGNKTYHGRGGADLLRGGRGNDRLYGGAGEDHLIGEYGNDRLQGGRGSDFLDGGPGNDRLSGGMGSDWLRGGPGDDVLRGGAGSDFMAGDGGRDTYSLSGNGAGDRDVILADGKDDIRGQSLWQSPERIGIDDVALPSIRVNDVPYTLAADGLKDFAHRVDGADIVYRAGD